MEFNEFKGRKGSFLGYFIAALFGAVIGGFLLLTFGPATLFAKFQPPETQPQNPPEAQVVQQVDNSEIGDVSIAAGKVMPSVAGLVTSNSEKSSKENNKDDQNVGSGIIIDSSGYILTNNHVAGMDTKKISVSLYDGGVFEGKTVWADPLLDLSIIKIDNADNLQAAVLGDSEKVVIGQQAIAIGNPMGLKYQRTVTAGIISAVNRTVEIEKGTLMEDLIQTDASINPGNSGGPLANINGEVIGINTVKVRTAEGMGFAIPINIIKPVIASIKESGTFSAPVLGVKGLDREIAGLYNYNINGGIYVMESVKDSPAFKAGIREGDVLLSVNGKDVNTMIELREALYTAGAGSTLKVKVKAPMGTIRDIDVVLEGEAVTRTDNVGDKNELNDNNRR